MTQKKYDGGAQSRKAHAQYRFEDIYPARMLASIPKQGIIMDIGTGVGRDAVAMHDRAKGNLLVIGIDPDEANYRKAVATYPDKDIVLCRDWNDVAHVKRNSQIAYLVGEVQKLPEPPSKLKADFINCSAVLMFLPLDEHDVFLKGLQRLTKPYSDIFLRFRTEMLKDSMTKTDPAHLSRQCLNAGFTIDVMPRFPDPPPSNRDFKWHDYLMTAIPK